MGYRNLEKLKDQGKVRFIGISGYPMHIFRYVLERTDLDVILSFEKGEEAPTDSGIASSTPPTDS